MEHSANRAEGARTAWAITLGVAGFVALAMLIAGIVLIAAHSFLRDDDGSFKTTSQQFQSSGYAVVSGDIDVSEISAAGVDLGSVANFSIEVEGTEERPIFAGVGPSAEVDGYLAAVAHSEVDDFDNQGDPVYTEVEGGAPPGPPGEQDFWLSRSQGAGLQSIDWDLSDDSLRAVAMNADGSQGVGIDGEAAVEVSWLLWLGVGLAAVGLLGAIASGFGINRLLRNRNQPPPTPTPGVVHLIDERLIGALHLSSGLHDDHPAAAHRAFQTSTVSALLDGAYEGDVTFAELAGAGDLGLGTLNGCDGEMIAIDGRFLRADVEGRVEEVPPEAQTPFAILTHFQHRHRLRLSAAASFDQLCAEIDRAIGHPEIVHALRIDGRFDRVHCRSVPKQHKPYRPLAEVLGEQSVFDFTDVEGTLLGFRFPDLGLGVGIAGYHLHFISDDRTRGGHVLDCRAGAEGLSAAVDDLADLYVETPPGIAIGGKVDQSSVESLERER